MTESAAADVAKARPRGDKKKKKENLGFWRENVEALAVAIVMALTVKLFFFEAFKVPTESMEPAIIGRTVGGDRLIVNKFVYQYRDPNRWEVVVFQYPLNKLVNYVKRCVGMPDEWLFIRNGDIYTAPGDLDHAAALAAAKIQRKPDSVQEAIFDRANLIPPTEREVAQFDRYWEKVRGDLGQGSVAALKDDEKVVFRAEAGPTLVQFTRPKAQLTLTREGGVKIPVPVISNRRYDDWSPSAEKPGFLMSLLGATGPANGSGPEVGREDEVGDMRLKFEIEPAAGKGAAIVELRDGTHGIPARVEFAVEGSGRSSRLVFGDLEKSFDAKLEAESWTEIAVANFDDRIVIWFDGDEVLRHDYEHDFIEPKDPKIGGGEAPPTTERPQVSFQPTNDLPHENSMLFGFDGGRASVREIEASRDLYYTYVGQTDFKIPEKSYLMCGDNSPNSLDARGFRASIIEYKNDDGEVVTMRGDAEGVSADESRPMENPFNGDRLFHDEYGNTVELDPGRILSKKTVYDHFVHRDQVVGRAYLTFWPLIQAGVIK